MCLLYEASSEKFCESYDGRVHFSKREHFFRNSKLEIKHFKTLGATDGASPENSESTSYPVNTLNNLKLKFCITNFVMKQMIFVNLAKRLLKNFGLRKASDSKSTKKLVLTQNFWVKDSIRNFLSWNL